MNAVKQKKKIRRKAQSVKMGSEKFSPFSRIYFKYGNFAILAVWKSFFRPPQPKGKRKKVQNLWAQQLAIRNRKRVVWQRLKESLNCFRRCLPGVARPNDFHLRVSFSFLFTL